MSEGVRSFTSEGKTALRYDNTPFAIGDYELKLLDNFEIVKGPSGPRVKTRWEALGTGKDGGKNRLLFHDFYTSLNPGKDGVTMPDRADQLVGMALALGEKFATTSVLDVTLESGAVIQALDARTVQAWLQSKAGTTVKAHVKIEPARAGYAAKNKLSYFIAPESGTETMSGLSDGVGISSNGVNA